MPRSSDPEISVNGYPISYRDVKYPRLEYKTGNLVVVLPKEYNATAELLEKHGKWITAKRGEIEQAISMAKKLKLKKNRDKDNFKRIVNSNIEKDERLIGVHINKLFYRRMNSKWGSLSSRGNLTLNPILQYLPEKVIEYVIFHEVTHLIDRKHDRRFWNTVGAVFPDYRLIEIELFAYWFLIKKNDIKH